MDVSCPLSSSAVFFLISLLPAFLHFSFFRLFSCQYHVWKVGRQVSLRFINLSVAERLKGRLLAQEDQEHLHPHGAFFSLQSMAVVSGTSSLEQRPAWEHAGAHWITVFLDDKVVFFFFFVFLFYTGGDLVTHLLYTDFSTCTYKYFPSAFM